MSIPVNCACGYQGTAKMFGFSKGSGLKISGVTTNCPQCGGRAQLQAGSYDFIERAVAVLRAPGMTRHSVKEFADVISSAAKGEVSAEQALEQAASISTAFAAFIRSAQAHGITFDRMGIVIGLILTTWGMYSANVDGEVALNEDRIQTVISEKILEETRKQSAAAEKTAKEARAQTHLLRELVATEELLQPGQTQMSGGSSRAERRRAAAIQRKRLKRIAKVPAKPRQPS